MGQQVHTSSMLSLPEKRDRLRKLRAEVPELHNWLEVLFRAMPHVVYVEYTHGINEFGADFVLEISNPTTGRNEYVGIIAKKGTIKQDTTEVERQIKECGIPRIIKNGRDEQSLPVIWVVSNEGITKNAEKKIRNDYRQYAIQFFGADDVITWTDRHASHLWDDVPSKIGQYLHEVRSQLDELDRRAGLLDEQVAGVKLEVDLIAVDTDTYKKRKATPLVSLQEEARTRKLIFLEGGMGAGKSQLLRDYGRELAKPTAFAENKVLPIFVNLRDFQQRFEGSAERVTSEVLGDLASDVHEGRASAILLIDGLDETSARDSAADLLAGLIDELRKIDRVSAVISCRPGVISSSVIRATPEIRHLEVRPLSIRKIANFIKAVCDKAKRSNRIVRDLGKSDLFKQLPQNPIAALLLSRLVLQSPDRDELPQTLTGLYEKALELMLGRWDIEKGLGSQQQYEVATRICGQIARLMIENRISAIGISEIEGRVRQYLDERNLSIDSKGLLDQLFSRSGVLVRDETAATVAFKHRSFAEYFCAAEWLHSSSFVVDQRALDPYWSTVYFFAVGQLSDCETTLKTILALRPLDEMQRFSKLFAAPDYLLAGHMTPYRIVEETFPDLLLEAARVYLEISSGRAESVLGKIPPMPLLYLMQMVLRERYGYQFFRRSIDAAAITIADSNEDDGVKAYALFFLGVIGIDLQYLEAMKFLAERFTASELPIGLGVAVQFESQKAQPRGMPSILRAFNKRVHSMLKNNRSLRAQLDDLFKRPANASLKKADKSNVPSALAAHNK